MKLKKIMLVAATLWGGLTTLSQAAIINISLNVTTADGFILRDSSNSALANGSLVRIGYFYNPLNGGGLASSAISALYQSSATFAANNSSLLGSFLEIGTGATGYTQLNGLAAGVMGLFGEEDRAFEAAPLSFPRLDDNNNQIAGSFYRGWQDATLPISNSNASPFNSLSTVNLAGALLSAIVYNNSSSATATELMVVRALVGSELPTESGEVANFAFGAGTSEILVGTGVPGAYQTIPEPGSGTLVGLGAALLLGLRRKFSLHV